MAAVKRRRIRCGWCGRTFIETKGRRIPKHKADRDWPYRDDDLCPGSQVLVKNLSPQAVQTHPQAMKVSSRKKKGKYRKVARG